MMHALQEVSKEHVDPVRVPRIQSGGERTSPAVRKPEELHHICTDKVERGERDISEVPQLISLVQRNRFVTTLAQYCVLMYSELT